MATDYNYQQNINGWVFGYSDIELKIDEFEYVDFNPELIK